jgi:hypothetical protein
MYAYICVVLRQVQCNLSVRKKYSYSVFRNLTETSVRLQFNTTQNLTNLSFIISKNVSPVFVEKLLTELYVNM